MASGFHPYPNADGQQRRKRRPWWRWLFCVLSSLALSGCRDRPGGYEMKTSRLQSQDLPPATLTYQDRTRAPASRDSLPDDGRSTSDSVMLMPMIQERLVSVATR